MNGPIKALMQTLEQASKHKPLRERYADASRWGRHEEVNRLLDQMIEEHLKPPPELDQRYWNDLLRRRMEVLARLDERLEDDEFDRLHGERNA